MTLTAEATANRIGTVRPPANLEPGKTEPPSVWKRFHAEKMALSANRGTLADRFGEERVADALRTAEHRQHWLDVHGFRAIEHSAEEQLRNRRPAFAHPDDVNLTETGALPGLSAEDRAHTALDDVRPGPKEEVAAHEGMPEQFTPDERVVMAAALVCEAAAGDDYANATAAEVLYTAYPDAAEAGAAAVGAHVELPVQ